MDIQKINMDRATFDAMHEKDRMAKDKLAEGISGFSKALENPAVQRQLSITDIPGKPMSTADLAKLMRADYEKLTTVAKTAGMALQ